MKKIWFSLYDNEIYNGKEDAVIDFFKDELYKNLENNYLVIYDELSRYLSKFQLEPQFNNTMVEMPKSWKVRSLRVWDVEMYSIQKHFPETMKLLNDLPFVLNIGFNLLEPYAKIKPHCGDTNAIYRCHLGLKIPKDIKLCKLKVNNIDLHWEEGKLISFIDAFEHSAVNNSSEQRIVLLFDILKPEFRNQRSKVCATVLCSFYLQQIGNYWNGIYNINRRNFRWILIPFVSMMQIFIPLRNWIRKLF